MLMNLNFEARVIQKTHKPSGKEKIIKSCKGKLWVMLFLNTINWSNETIEMNNLVTTVFSVR